MPGITDTPVLDVAIGLAFIYVLFSLLASTLQEGIASLLALRAATLEKGLRSMLSGDGGARDGERDLVDEFYRHPLVDSLRRGTKLDVARLRRSRPWKAGRLPSYISPRVFSLTLLDTLAPPAGRTSFDAVRDEIKAMKLPAGVQDRLLLLLDEANGDLDAFRHNVEAWFDDTMARVSGWYKRQSQLILLAIGVAITVALNVNSITIAERLWKDPAVRSAVVAQAQSPSVTEKFQGDAEQQLRQAAANVDKVAELGIPLGRSDALEAGAVRTALGWLITIIALSLGAPFWFDALSRLSRLRTTGKPETPLPASERGKRGERVRGGL